MPIAGLISKNGCDVSDQIRLMLSMMRHHARAKTSVAAGNRLTFNGGDRVFSRFKPGSDRAIGSCGFKVGAESPFQPLLDFGEKFILAFEGRIHGVNCEENDFSEAFRGHSGVYEAASLLEDAVTGDDRTAALRAATAVTGFRGGFSLAFMDRRRIVVARDVLGIEPLYWGEDERYYGFASERKALWRIGIKYVSAFPPGHVAAISSKAVFRHRAVALERPKRVEVGLEDASQALRTLIQRIFKTRLQDVRELGVFFSGGVDSSLVAKCVMDLGVKPVLYVAGFEGSHDVDVAEKSAEELGCPLHEEIMPLDEAEEYISKVVYAVEEDDLMKIGVGLPLYLAAEAAAGDGVGIVLSGQGVDELFGGYARYCRILEMRGTEELAEEMWNDVLHMADVNLQRDKGIALANSIELSLPFMDQELIQMASSLPTSLKVESSKDSLRKPVLRKTARLLGLSEEIARRPKKAMQYGSGTHKAIRSIAKRKGFRRSRDYVTSVFREVFKGIL